MDLNLIKDVVKEIQKNDIVEKFMSELSNFLENNQEINQNRKEGHLYLVTEDRNGEVYLWDFTEKPEHEFKEVFTSKELIDVAKEGAMLQFKDGKYELYSTDGYDMLENG
mgnify:FL=1